MPYRVFTPVNCDPLPMEYADVLILPLDDSEVTLPTEVIFGCADVASVPLIVPLTVMELAVTVLAVVPDRMVSVLVDVFEAINWVVT